MARKIKPDLIILDSINSDKYDAVKTLRFEKGLENVYFCVVAEGKTVPVDIPASQT